MPVTPPEFISPDENDEEEDDDEEEEEDEVETNFNLARVLDLVRNSCDDLSNEDLNELTNALTSEVIKNLPPQGHGDHNRGRQSAQKRR